MVKLGLDWSFTPTRSEVDTWMHWFGFFFVAWLVHYATGSMLWAVIIGVAASIGLELAQKYSPQIFDVGEPGTKPPPQVRDLISDFLGIGFFSSLSTTGYQGFWDWYFTAGSFFWLLYQQIKSKPRKHKF